MRLTHRRFICILRLLLKLISLLIFIPIRAIIQLIGYKKLNEKFIDNYNLGNNNIISVNHNVLNLFNIVSLLLQKIIWCFTREIMIDEIYPNHKIYKINSKNKTDTNSQNYSYSECDLYSVINPNVFTILLFGSST